MAKASAEAGATHFVAEGDPVPGDLSPEVRLVGPGIPIAAEELREALGLPSDVDVDAFVSTTPGYDALQVRALRDELRGRGLPVTGVKAELVARLAEHDAGRPS